MRTEDVVFGALLLSYAVGLWMVWKGSSQVTLTDRIKTILLFLAVLILPALGWLSGWRP